MAADIHKTGLLAIRDGRVLLCRKRKRTALLILPGGKFEPGETAEQCLQRELSEELSGAQATGLCYIGTYQDEAAGEPGRTVRVELFGGELDREPAASNEIAALVWFHPSSDWAVLSPTLRNRILPDLIARGLLSAGPPAAAQG